MTEKPYNPLDTKNLGASVAEALLERTVRPLGGLPAFNGAGLYAIYYTGEFPAYQRIAERNRDEQFGWPIYVGKAVPPGARKALASPTTGRWLHKRLGEHAETIAQAENLELEDFYCRYLVVEDIWIPLGESLLIAAFSPIWNRLVDGFGNHDPGGGRYNGMRPRWHVLHPGIGWANKCQPRPETSELIASEIESYLRFTPVPSAHPRLLARE
ncbi:Eco29kI family restriction endonuclease [Microvirga lenta]|uniref:Eco29kI family restriction endonuclease n=1 Tax=Microvirga lenta TaxID=2881337 RepID=UPI001D00046D|nr:Eco29kI family restriction endonuclease [Microvirga lenta]MCB5177584.1 Eco29kI family restriction endonuclease [Microvirga lenta]